MAKPLNCSDCETSDVVERFTRHAACRPDAIAVTLDEQAWSYAQLDAASNTLGWQLKSMGVGPESFVVLLLHRSFAQVVAILAVLKAGGAYVPIDPDYPEERVRLILEDCGAKFLLVDAQGPHPKVGPGVVVIPVDDHDAALLKSHLAPLSPATGANNAAYMIYTSGSTGRPKGVIVTRHNVNRLFTTTEGIFDFGPTDVWPLFHSYAFDFSVWELWGALAYGGRLVIVPLAIARSATDFHDLLERDRITVLNQTPSAFFNLMRVAVAAGSPLLGALRHIIFGGEALDPQRLTAWFERYGDQRPRLANLYGITETTVHTTFRPLCLADVQQSASRIGRPLPDLEVYLVNPEGQLVENGVAGEIWVAGDGVARGYHNRPELTQERFVPDPFQPSRRAYRSGDLARRGSDGELEYLGRIDNQVKVRGYRIELGEIEAALRRHPGVADAVVDVRACGNEPLLVGYVIPAHAGLPEFEDLRAFLHEQLPEYMVCHRFVQIDTVPLTPHGKVDRRALPDPGTERPRLSAGYVEPRTDLERRFCKCFSTAIGIDRVGINDDFLALGGTSLVATRLCAHLSDECGSLVTTVDIFTHRTVAALAPIALLRQAQLRQLPTLSVLPVARGGDLPLTHSQERVWLIQTLAPNSVAYTFDASLRFRGSLDPTALRRALERLVDRHEVLRTTFPQVDGHPVQRIHAHGVVRLEEISLDHLAPAEAHQEIERQRAIITQQVFDMERLPLIEWRLYRISEHEHILLHREHHLLHDGWAFFVLIGDLLELYWATRDNRLPRLLPLNVQIADFAVAQRRWVESGLFEDQLSFWREKLRDAPALLALPADHPRPAEASYKGNSLRFHLEDDLVRLAKNQASRAGTTFSMTMLAPFVALLGRLSGETDLCIGSGVANRRTPESEPIVGMVVNNVVLRFDLRNRRTLNELLDHVREVVLTALDNQDLPFDVVMQSVGGQRHSSANPLCQVFFTTYDGPVHDLDLPNLEITTEVGLPTFSAKFDLNVILLSQSMPGDRKTGPCGRDVEQVTVIWEYSTDLFEQSTMERLLARYLGLLKECLLNPDTPLNEFDWTSEEERHWLFQVARGPTPEYPREASISELFERQAAVRPKATALICGQERLSYGELDRWADSLALRLRADFDPSEQVVGLFFERGPAAVAAMLGIVKAGAAYLPLNPLDPPARLATLIREAGATVVVTCQSLAGRLPQETVRTVFLDAPPDIGDVSEIARNRPGSGGCSLACVLFTSGSTGLPKGVEVLHRGIVRLLFSQDYAHFGPDEIFLQLAPLTFDASTFEIWGALLHGGTLVIHPENVPDLANLGRSILEHGVTTLWLNAGLFNAVMDERPSILRPLRQLLIGGEALSVPHVRRARELMPTVRMVNGYGPTENTTFSCCYPIPVELPKELSSIPIGRPLANSTAYILDERQQLVPPGVTGEIYLGGDGIARGYRGRADLSAERFLPDPFSGTSDAHLYRSGDFGAVLSDGTIQFRGRRDAQVKIRGFRVELSEVESVLEGTPGVQAGAVIVQEDAVRGKSLVAFIVPSGTAPISDVLRTHLSQQLPEYLVPDRFVITEKLPLTANGKLNRAALSAMGATAGIAPARTLVEPRTAQETEVLNVFREVLGRRDIGIEDNFFRSGGHSLLAIRLAGKISERLGVQVGLRLLFQAPTVARLCAALTEPVQPVAPWCYLLPVRATGAGRPIFFIPGGDGGAGDMTFYARFADCVPDRPFYGLLSTGMKGENRLLHPTVERLSAAFIEEMRQVQPEGPYDLAGGCVGGIIAFEMARQLAAAGHDLSRVVLIDTGYPTSYLYLRQLVRRTCAQLRFHLQRLLMHRNGQLGRRGQMIYDRISGWLPFAERDAHPGHHPGIFHFAATMFRYQAKPYSGRLHLILSKEFAATAPEKAWGRWAAGGTSVALVPGDHWTYLRDHFDETGAVFRQTLEGQA